MFVWGPVLMTWVKQGERLNNGGFWWVWGQIPDRFDKAVINGWHMHKGLISDSASNQLDSLESHFNSVSIGKMRGLEQIKGCRPFGGGKEILFILLKPGECVFVCCWGRGCRIPLSLCFQTNDRKHTAGMATTRILEVCQQDSPVSDVAGKELWVRTWGKDSSEQC